MNVSIFITGSNSKVLSSELSTYLAYNIGGTISANSITKFLKGENITVSVDTVLNYIEYINNSMIVNKVSRYNIRGKSVMTLLEKYYFVDLGLLQLKSSPVEKKVGGRINHNKKLTNYVK